MVIKVQLVIDALVELGGDFGGFLLIPVQNRFSAACRGSLLAAGEKGERHTDQAQSGHQLIPMLHLSFLLVLRSGLFLGQHHPEGALVFLLRTVQVAAVGGHKVHPLHAGGDVGVALGHPV